MRIAPHVLLSAALVAVLALPARAGDVVLEGSRWRFVENFRFEGNHAATVGTAPDFATTVWWPEKDWDARCDTTFISVEPLGGTNPPITNRFHIDIHKAASPDPHDGRLSNTVYAVGGDGSPGLGIMHLDYQDLCSARLRNPMLIAPAQPGVVSFYAPLFNTTGHWWEIVLTPTAELVGAEHSSVPSVASGLPFPNSTNANPGPGHHPSADSINLVSIGSSDVPCNAGVGWRTRFGVTKSVDGTKTHYVTQDVTQQDFLPTDPSQANTLVQWRIEYTPGGVTLAADLDGDGTPTPVESWDVTIPWSEVHVHLMAVAYQSDHHPQEPCFLGHIREVQWRNVSVSPVKYSATDVFPKNAGEQQTPKELGFSAYDIRDIQRFGTINGVAQPNTTAFSSNHPGRYCVDGGFPCFSAAPKTPSLGVTLPAGATTDLAAAVLVADLKTSPTLRTASALATLNGTALGRLPEHDDVLPDAGSWSEWVRRAVPVPAAAVQDGTNTLALALETGAYVDRVELELLYASTNDVFRDGFEGAAPRPAPGTKALRPAGITFPLVPVGPGERLLHQCAE